MMMYDTRSDKEGFERQTTKKEAFESLKKHQETNVNKSFKDKKYLVDKKYHLCFRTENTAIYEWLKECFNLIEPEDLNKDDMDNLIDDEAENTSTGPKTELLIDVLEVFELVNKTKKREELVPSDVLLRDKHDVNVNLSSDDVPISIKDTNENLSVIVTTKVY